MRSLHKNNVIIRILVVKLLKKEVSHKFLGGLVQKLYLLDFGGGHFGFRALEKNAGIFWRNLGAKFLINGLKK